MKFGNYQLDIVAKQVMINIPTVFVFKGVVSKVIAGGNETCVLLTV